MRFLAGLGATMEGDRGSSARCRLVLEVKNQLARSRGILRLVVALVGSVSLDLGSMLLFRGRA